MGSTSSVLNILHKHGYNTRWKQIHGYGWDFVGPVTYLKQLINTYNDRTDQQYRRTTKNRTIGCIGNKPMGKRSNLRSQKIYLTRVKRNKRLKLQQKEKEKSKEKRERETRAHTFSSSTELTPGPTLVTTFLISSSPQFLEHYQ